jgi:uncharacterized membrane protein
VLAIGLAIVAITTPPDGAWTATVVVLCLIAWNVFTIVYVVLTDHAFRPVDTAEFVARMDARKRLRPRVLVAVLPRGDGPSLATSAALVAFAVVLILPHVDGVEVNEWLLVPLSLSILPSCCVLSVVSYALHYAQYDLDQPGLDFPGERTNAYKDSPYLSIAVATTLGATDVNITTVEMRRVVNTHVILTFLYNAVIIAILAAILIR